MRKINSAGMALIRKSENDNDPKSGFRTRIINGEIFVYYVPYICPAGVCTIGYGTICYPDGKSVTMNDPEINEDQARAFLQHEADEKCAALQSFILHNKVFLNENQFSALASLAYNCGVGAVTNQDSSMRRALLSGGVEDIKKAFRLWNKITVKRLGFKFKKIAPGLVERREREIKLYFSKVA